MNEKPEVLQEKYSEHTHDSECVSCDMFKHWCEFCQSEQLWHEYECPEAQE